ncbi:MAG: hypothetical protein HGA47_02705 [Zoogloea sp.]|nr:hypothetical protein [Zoogloea sp.]
MEETDGFVGAAGEGELMQINKPLSRIYPTRGRIEWIDADQYVLLDVRCGRIAADDRPKHLRRYWHSAGADADRQRRFCKGAKGRRSGRIWGFGAGWLGGVVLLPTARSVLDGLIALPEADVQGER